MRTQRPLILVGDFETTVYEGQERTDVWASALVEIGTEDVKIFGSIEETFDYLKSLERNTIIYYHNLKFDGQFWLSYLLNKSGFRQAIHNERRNDFDVPIFDEIYKMKSGEFQYSISDMGMWYKVVIKSGVNYIELRDSLKLLPFSVKQISNGFSTKHKKLEMEYKGYRYPGCYIAPEEQKYIANDVLVIKEALEFMFKGGHNQLTIGACCLSEYKNTSFFYDFDKSLPNLYDIPIDESFESPSAGHYIRKSYHGGWCYIVPSKANKVMQTGTTADVNSLYPSMMHSMSGNKYPIGSPKFWKGSDIPTEALDDNHYYFIRIRTRFKIKENHLPCIQIKNSFFYRSTEWLETSDATIRGKKDKKTPVVERIDGSFGVAKVTMTLTQTDYQLIKDQYELFEAEILDGCYFRAISGLFDEYIDKYKKIKQESKGPMRTLAKLFLNNLYGKMATSPEASYKVAFVREDESIGYKVIHQDTGKKPGYIPIGSAITSYARNFTIRAAQANYYGPDKPGFIYADTDSIHCDLPADQIRGIKVHDTEFCCWKLESYWDKAIFIRQKTYAEHVTHEDGVPIDEPYWDLKCAGMPDKCKDLFLLSLDPETKQKVTTQEYKEKYHKGELEFLSTTRSIEDFKIGLIVPGKLLPVTIPGGVVLEDVSYELRPTFRG